MLRFRSFVLGSLVAVLLTAGAAIVMGMSWPAVMGFAVGVWVVAQLLYVGLVALLAREAASGTSQTDQSSSRGTDADIEDDGRSRG